MEYTCPWCIALCGSIREVVSKKRKVWGRGREVTDNILFNYYLNKNIAFSKERNQLSQTDEKEKK
jgi:hypothetical protein